MTIKLAYCVSATVGVSSGLPCVDGTGIRVDILAGRFRSGDSVIGLVEEFELDSWDVEAAIRFEMERMHRRQPIRRAVQQGDRAVMMSAKEGAKA